ncbi:4a-hydroxytetrahydrobiopterin dehydratase [Candidatus Parcubacteria bacterium]|nr:MAG: 4a-hydroxytetrahydrobiopterin dehydratase [Candidatus Parcubacteria bacterium]
MTLAEKHCVPCEGGVLPLTREEAETLLKQVAGWELSDDVKKISKTFKTKNFVSAMDLANRITAVAEKEGHHPDLHISWGKVGIDLTTHAIKGLSVNDFILAAKIDAL